MKRLSQLTQSSEAQEKPREPSRINIEHTAPNASTLNVIKKAQQSSKLWSSKFDMQKRQGILDDLFASDEADNAIQPITLETETSLPSPTGETNTLSLHPRGVILCMGEFGDVKRQMHLALSTGNSVIVHPYTGREDLERIANALSEKTKLENLDDILNGPIEGVAIDGADRAEIAEFLCRREGAFLPLLSGSSDPYRFCHERTVTHDITAAGGNASLLTL